MNNKPKEPLIAVILTFIFPGIGHIYAGFLKTGIAFLIINIVVGLSTWFYAIHPTMKSNILIVGSAILMALLSLFIVFHSYFCAKAFNKRNNLEQKITGFERFLYIMGIILIGFLFNPSSYVIDHIRENVIEAFKIPSETMSPTLIKGDRLLTDKSIYKKEKPVRGDIIVFKYPMDMERRFIKRIVAMGGEAVEIKEGDIYINGNLVTTPKIKNIHYYNRGKYGNGAIKVPEGHYFVLGDNSASSSDSRFWGFVPEANLVGKAYKIYYPIGRSGAIR